MRKKIAFLILILLSTSLYAKNEKFYLNGANTTKQQNTEIKSGMALVKQNIKKANTIKFNLLYLTPQDDSYAICGSFQTINDNTPERFVISQDNLMIESKDEKKFKSVWTNFCE